MSPEEFQIKKKNLKFNKICNFFISSINLISLMIQPKLQFELNIFRMASKPYSEISGLQINENQRLKEAMESRPIVYRQDIDGLRAIAIIIVVIFHAWPQVLPGGFVGVDVFFVISGYLITGIIVKENLRKQFSYSNFYNRRIKRICPALIATLTFVLVVGYQKQAARNLAILTETLAASGLFCANLYLMVYQKDYFDPDVKSNPLIHLWSLGVQEQFYILWPFFILLLLNKIPNRAFKSIIYFIAISFTLNIICARVSPKIDFYFPFCRFWQMAIGGLISVKNIQLKNKTIANTLSFVGVTSIILAACLLKENSIYPDWWSLLPTLGAACIIQARNFSFINQRILASKPMAFIGKISYSLYLWHWPLFVLFKIMYPRGSTSIFTNISVIFIISIFCSIFSYYFIENPIRKTKGKYFSFILLTLIILLSLSAIIIRNKRFSIFQNRLDSQTGKQIELDMIPTQGDFFLKNQIKHPNSSKNKIRSLPNATKIKYSYFYSQVERLNYKLLEKKIDSSSRFYRQYVPKQIQHYEVINEGKKKILLFAGDSYARVGQRFQKLYENAVKQNKTQNFPTIVGIISPGIPFLPSNPTNDFILQWIQEFQPSRVLFIYKLNFYFEEEHIKNVVFHLGNVVKSITQKGINATVSTLRPEGSNFHPAFMFDNNGIIQQNIKPFNLTLFQMQFYKTKVFLQSQITKNGGSIVDYTDNQCWEGVCHVVSPHGENIYFDGNHYTNLYSRQWMSAADHLVDF